MDDWMAPIGFGTLLVTVAGFGVALVMLVRSMRKSNDAAHARTEQNLRDIKGEVTAQVQALDAKNEAAHAKTEQHVRDLDAKNEAAHAKTEQHVRDLDAKNEAAHAGTAERIDTSRAEVLGQVRHLDAKNEAAHAGIVERIDSSRGEALARADEHARKLDAVAHDVAFLAGRQKGTRPPGRQRCLRRDAGRGVPQDDREAARWWRLAADRLRDLVHLLRGAGLGTGRQEADGLLDGPARGTAGEAGGVPATVTSFAVARLLSAALAQERLQQAPRPAVKNRSSSADAGRANGRPASRGYCAGVAPSDRRAARKRAAGDRRPGGARTGAGRDSPAAPDQHDDRA